MNKNQQLAAQALRMMALTHISYLPAMAGPALVATWDSLWGLQGNTTVIWRVTWSSSGWLVGAVVMSLSLQMLPLYSPAGHFFNLTPLGAVQCLVLLGGLAIGILTSLTITGQVVNRLGPT